VRARSTRKDEMAGEGWWKDAALAWFRRLGTARKRQRQGQRSRAPTESVATDLVQTIRGATSTA
jgi:hypothetical protein